MSKETRVYKDLDLNFSPHPVTKDVVKRTGNSAIIGALKNLMMTNYFERPFKPTFGTRIRSLLFEQINFITASALETEIYSAITNFERRVSVLSVKVIAEPEKYRYSVTLTFSINNLEEPITITMFLEKVR